MINFLANLLATLPLVSALLAIAAIRTKRERRAEQLVMPVIAVIYLIAALILLYRFNGFLFDILRSISQIVPIDPGLPGSPSLYLLQNLLILLVFLVIKGIVIPILKRMARRWHNGLVRIADGIYEFFDEDSVWFLSRSLSNLRRYWQALYWTSVVVMVLFLALKFTFPSWPGFLGIAYPALAAMVIGEFFFALDGYNKREFTREIEGEQDAAIRVSNYGPLRGVLRSTFPGRVLSDDVLLSSRAALDSGYQVGELARSGDEKERLVGSYFSRLRQSHYDVDINLVDASLNLMKGRSVLINNPFYLDLTPYVSLPAYYYLLQSRRVLIISGRDSLVPDLAEWIRQGLEDVTGIPHLWNVEQLSERRQTNLHVGILPFADVHNLEVMRSNLDFLEGVEFVVLAEPSRMMATGQLGLSLLLSKCGRDGRPMFLGFDGNHDGLVDSLSHLLKTNFTEVVASGLPQGASNEVVWNSDGPHMHTEILPRISRYLGMGTEIGAVALKYQVPQFHWVGGDAFPVEDMQWIAEQYYAQINRFADIELSQDALDEAFVPISNPWAVPQHDNYFLIVEDEIANVYETIRKYATRARESGFVNLISEDYLLRDYMVDNRALLSADPKAIPPIVADFARTERNLALRMVMAMAWSEVSETELEREFELTGQMLSAPSRGTGATAVFDREPAVITRLRNLIVEHTNVTEVSIRQLTGFELGDKEDTRQAYFRMDVGPQMDQIISSLRPAYFYVEDEQGGVNRIGSLLFDHVYQALLPGQFVTYAGKYYEVQSIGSDDVRSGVVLRRAADHIRDRRVYRQWRDFSITDLIDQDFVGSTTNRAGLRIRKVLGSIAVECRGYFELTSRGALGSARPVYLDRIPTRNYSNKSLLEISLPDVPDSVRKTITLLLNEMFLTVFPHAYPYVIALTADPDEEFGHLLSKLEGSVDPRCIYIVEDSMIDLGLLVAVERNWDRFLEIITDYLAWVTTPVEEAAEQETKEKREFVLEFPDLPAPVLGGSWLTRAVRRIKGAFGRGKGDSDSATKPVTEQSASDGTDVGEDDPHWSESEQAEAEQPESVRSDAQEPAEAQPAVNDEQVPETGESELAQDADTVASTEFEGEEGSIQPDEDPKGETDA